VSTHFTGTHLSIDPHRPPQPLDDTAHPTGIKMVKEVPYSGLGNPPTAPNHIEPLFALLTSSKSPWAIPLPSLGDPSATPAILAAIKRQHGIIQAQTFRHGSYHSANLSST